MSSDVTSEGAKWLFLHRLVRDASPLGKVGLKKGRCGVRCGWRQSGN